MTFHFLSVITYTKSVIVCEMITHERTFEILLTYVFDLRKKVTVMWDNVAKFILDVQLIRLHFRGKNGSFNSNRFV